MSKGVSSMQDAFEKVGEHDEIIHQGILPQLKEMRQEQEEIRKEQETLAKEIAKIALSQSSLELTVMKDGQQTRDLLGRFVDHYFSTDDKKFTTQEKITMKKLGTKEKVILAFIGALLGSGGILMSVAAILQIFF